MTAWFAYPISHGYYPNYDANTPDTPHYAVDIGMPMDTPITAIKSGKVVQADYAVWNGAAGGGEIFVKPDDGSTEYYYYHLDQNQVVAGQHVNAGDVVGLSGGQNSGGSHNTDPMWSTGPHLHVGYFTSFTNTPVGTRPEGPDITPTITYLKMSGGSSPPLTPTQQAAASSSGGSVNQLSPAQATQLASSGLTKIAIFFVALALVGGGAYLLFRKQINATVKKGVDAAKLAALA